MPDAVHANDQAKPTVAAGLYAGYGVFENSRAFRAGAKQPCSRKKGVGIGLSFEFEFRRVNTVDLGVE